MSPPGFSYSRSVNLSQLFWVIEVLAVSLSFFLLFLVDIVVGLNGLLDGRGEEMPEPVVHPSSTLYWMIIFPPMEPNLASEAQETRRLFSSVQH